MAVVADADVDVFAALFGGEGDVAAAGGVFDGVVQQIGDGLGDKLAVAHDVQPAFDVRCKAVFAFFGHDVVEFGEIVADGAQAFVFEVVFGAAFDLCDVQQGVEGFEEVFGVFDGVGDDFAQGGRFAVAVQQRDFHAVAHAVERAAQVVRDVVGDLPLAGDERFDAVKHVVQVVGELAHFVGVIGVGGDALGEVAIHDAPRGAADARDAVDDGVADEKAADEGGDEEQAGDVDAVVEHPLEHFALIGGVVGGDEGVAVVGGIDDDDAHDEVDAHVAAGVGRGVDAAEVGDAAVQDDEVGGAGVDGCGRVVVAIGKGQAVAAAGRAFGGDAEGDVRVAGNALDDAKYRGVKADAGALFKAATQAGGFGKQARVDLFADFFFGAAVEGVHRDAGDEARCQGKEQGKFEGGSSYRLPPVAQPLSYSRLGHRGCILRRVRYESEVGRSLCRFCCAGARCGRQ